MIVLSQDQLSVGPEGQTLGGFYVLNGIVVQLVGQAPPEQTGS